MQVIQELYSNGMTIPDSAIERLARFFLPRMQAFLESEQDKQTAPDDEQSEEKAAKRKNTEAA